MYPWCRFRGGRSDLRIEDIWSLRMIPARVAAIYRLRAIQHLLAAFKWLVDKRKVKKGKGLVKMDFFALLCCLDFLYLDVQNTITVTGSGCILVHFCRELDFLIVLPFVPFYLDD